MALQNTLRPALAAADPGAADTRTRRRAAAATSAAGDSAAPAAMRAAGAAAASRALASMRALAYAHSQLQDGVARAQQSIEYLDRVAGQLAALKDPLTAKLSGARVDQRQLETRVGELAAGLAARAAGGGVDANLNFNSAGAAQRFRIRGLDIDSLGQGAPQKVEFSLGAAGDPQLAATIEPDMDASDIAARLERALAPLKVHAQLDQRGQLEFSTSEANYPAVKDSIAVAGRGRVATEPVAPQLDAATLGTDDTGALRQSLRDVVQAQARVQRARAAASAALSTAGAALSTAGAALTTASVPATQADASARAAGAVRQAQAFVDTAANPDYDSLIALSSALVGVSRDRVLALLCQR